MRPRKEIEKEYGEQGFADFEVIVEILLDIRDAVSSKNPLPEERIN